MYRTYIPIDNFLFHHKCGARSRLPQQGRCTSAGYDIGLYHLMSITPHKSTVCLGFSIFVGVQGVVLYYTTCPWVHQGVPAVIQAMWYHICVTVLSSSLVPRPHPAHARRRGLVSQLQILGLALEAWSGQSNCRAAFIGIMRK